MRYRLIAFDAYGTLFDVYSISTLAERLFPNQGKALAVLWRDKQLEYSRLTSLADPNPNGSKHYQSFWDLTIAALHYSCAQLGLHLKDEYEAQLLEQYAKLNPFSEARQVLHDIHASGLKTCVLSNGSMQMLSWAIGHNEFDAYLDTVISVDDARQFKITPASYQLILKHFSLAQKEVLFVSCNAWDIVGANWFGFDTFWVNRYQLPFEKIGLAPTHQGHDLNDLYRLLQT